MRSMVFLLALGAVSAWAQAPTSTDTMSSDVPPYTPAVPSASVNAYGAYGYHGGGASTVAGSALRGMADVISAEGDYNLSTSAAAVNMTQAEKQRIQNRSAATNTYFQMRQINRQYREAEAGPTPTMEQLTRIAQSRLPKSLKPSEVNEVNGKISWPGVLQTPDFAEHRARIEPIVALWAKYGGLGYTDQVEARAAIRDMAAQLKSQIKTVPPQDYVEARDFLDRLLYASTGSTLG